MNNWKSIVGGILAVVALLAVGGSTLDDPQAVPRSADQIVFATATFLSVVVLHWLLWRFIVPSSSTVPPRIASFIPPPSRRGFFSGTIAFGYSAVAFYCTELSGYLVRSDPRGRVGFLVMGLSFIGLGTAARLRDVFSTLTAAHERQHGNA